jgi:hypothetical protein
VEAFSFPAAMFAAEAAEAVSAKAILADTCRKKRFDVIVAPLSSYPRRTRRDLQYPDP